MQLPPFKLEEFWEKYEFSVPHLLCSSDAESWTVNEILSFASPELKNHFENLSLGYTESTGHPLLRNEIARLYNSLDSNNILTFAGAEEGIYCLLKALVQPGDHVITFEPCYQSLSTLPLFLGAQLTSIALNPKKQWQANIQDIESAFQHNTKLLILNQPHNPTGSLLSKELFQAIIKIAKERNVYIFCDEVYRYLEIDEAKRLPSIADAYEKGIALNAMTKAFGLAGLRIGWLATQDRALLAKITSYKLYTSICNSAPSEILAMIALKSKESILKRNRRILIDNFHLFELFMQKYHHILSWTAPRGGTIAVVELLLPISIETFAEDLRKKMGVLIMPGTVFDLPGNFFRIGFGKKNFPRILELFEMFLKIYIERKST